MTGRLDGKVALVTGAARMRGIGRATALRLAAEGAAVVVSGSRRDPNTFPEPEKAAGWRGSTSVAAEIEAQGGRAVAIDCDVTAPGEIDRLFADAEQRLGVPDAIVNNAGVAGGAGAAPLLDLSDADWRHTVDVNLTGVFFVCRAAGRTLRAAGKPGAIVNLSSLAGRVGMANYGAYCASKFGVIGLTQQLALELAGYGIRVNCICPGTIDTDMMDSTFQRLADQTTRKDFAQIKQAVGRGVPLGRQGLPQEIAAMIAFILTEDASYITGQTINVDGGFRLD